MASSNVVKDVVNQYTKSVGFLNEANERVQDKIDAYLKARNDLIDEINELKQTQADSNQMVDELEQFLKDEEKGADGSYVG